MKFELQKLDLGKKQWMGIIEKDDDWYAAEMMFCQKCKCPLSFPIYVCETQRYKWFCEDCEKSDKPQLLCEYDKNIFMRSMGTIKEEHIHICIKKIEVENEATTSI